MGIWKLIKTREDVVAFQTAMEAPIPAWRAADLFDRILGDDSLFDHFLTASSIDKSADVRSLIVNRIDQLYFTETPVEEICEFTIGDFLRTSVDEFKVSPNDIFFKLQTVSDLAEAKEPVMWVCDDSDGDPQSYTVKRDLSGMDYVVITPKEQAFRVEAINACVLKFHPENAMRYGVSMNSFRFN
jgi:hypothetical protein